MCPIVAMFVFSSYPDPLIILVRFLCILTLASHLSRVRPVPSTISRRQRKPRSPSEPASAFAFRGLRHARAYPCHFLTFFTLPSLHPRSRVQRFRPSHVHYLTPLFYSPRSNSPHRRSCPADPTQSRSKLYPSTLFRPPPKLDSTLGAQVSMFIGS